MWTLGLCILEVSCVHNYILLLFLFLSLAFSFCFIYFKFHRITFFVFFPMCVCVLLHKIFYCCMFFFCFVFGVAWSVQVLLHSEKMQGGAIYTQQPATVIAVALMCTRTYTYIHTYKHNTNEQTIYILYSIFVYKRIFSSLCGKFLFSSLSLSHSYCFTFFFFFLFLLFFAESTVVVVS